MELIKLQEKLQEIKAIIVDWDGSIVPQGGWINPKISAFIRFFSEFKIPMGIATGKNADYSRGIASGIGIRPWNYIVAESGGIFLELEHIGPPPAFKQYPLIEAGLDDLAEFSHLIHIEPFNRRFKLEREWQKYRPELKETIITLFPPAEDIEITRKWAVYFTEIVELHTLNLEVQRHSDGAIDVLPLFLSKKLGVKQVCRLLKCNSANILTVVDGVNDYELAEGTTAIAVANAVPKIKSLVRQQGGFIATLPDGLGFAQGLYYFAKQNAFSEEKSQKIAELIETTLPEVCKR